MWRTMLLAAAAFVPIVAYSASRCIVVPVYACLATDNAANINSLLAQGGDVEIGPGNCPISTSLIMDVSGTTLNGSGSSGSAITTFVPLTGSLDLTGPNSFDMIAVGDQGNAYHGAGFILSNFAINGNEEINPNTTQKTDRGIVVQAGVYADSTYSFGANISNVQTHDLLGGVSIAGSDSNVWALTSFNNWHAGIYVAGNGNDPGHTVANNDKVTGSTFFGNERQNNTNGTTQTWDTLDYDQLSANGIIGGPNPGDGNTVSGGDILIACDSLAATNCTTQSGYLVQGNTVNPGPHSSIRIFGTIDSAQVLNNHINNSGVGVVVTGPTTNTTVQNNTIVNLTSAGIQVFGYNNDTTPPHAPPDTTLIDSNSITMGNQNRPAVLVTSGSTNVTATNNNANGENVTTAYNFSAAGTGLVTSNNN